MRRAPLLLLAALALALAGCGDDGGSGSGGDAEPRLTVSAAASLKGAFEAYGEEFPDATARFSFAGSDELAAQIRKGVKPDVLAAANTKLPDQLHAEGRVGKPTIFAGNRLVLAVPADSARVGSLDDLAEPGVELAVGAESVPVGSYTREVLGRLPTGEEKAILANVRSNEPDVKGVVGKLTQGAADAGFVYVTDVVATEGKVKAIELPASLQPSVEYGVAVVKGAKEPEAARAFIEGLTDGAGARALDDAGFEPPPK
ncbi:MAG TPA: molybdate ABC transporter substrate-binding protein [Thermoleophilaceae bacterium]|nr:molybdate ABC transporter substrate-binding protein [Thermoleophilaceae bacterium]